MQKVHETWWNGEVRFCDSKINLWLFLMSADILVVKVASIWYNIGKNGIESLGVPIDDVTKLSLQKPTTISFDCSKRNCFLKTHLFSRNSQFCELKNFANWKIWQRQLKWWVIDSAKSSIVLDLFWSLKILTWNGNLKFSKIHHFGRWNFHPHNSWNCKILNKEHYINWGLL